MVTCRPTLSIRPTTERSNQDASRFFLRRGLKLDAGDWVSFHRNAGQDLEAGGITTSVTGLSEHPMRHMYKQWSRYMSAGG